MNHTQTLPILPQDERTEMTRMPEKEKTSPGVKASVFQRVSSNRGKRTLMKAEMGQISAAMASPSFQEDPFAAIQARTQKTCRLRSTFSSLCAHDREVLFFPVALLAPLKLSVFMDARRVVCMVDVAVFSREIRGTECRCTTPLVRVAWSTSNSFPARR